MAKVFLSAGHGGSDPGACANGLYEKTINLNALLACKAELERHGVTVVASRTTDANDPVQDEVREANASGADLVVSFHANAGGGDGFEAYYYAGDANGKRIAQLGEKYVKQLGQNSRGCKSGDHLMFVRETYATAVLFESFFVDNATDKAIGDTVAEQSAFGVAYAKAILEYFGITYKPAAASSSKPAASSGKLYRVQVGAFSSKANAEKLAKELQGKGYQTIIKEG
jgi:N-acetylmuramoyl-L-alanine amidase